MTHIATDLAMALDPSRLARVLGMTLDAWQLDVLLSPARRQLWNCARQTGKTTTSSLKALATSLSTPGSLVLAVAPAQRQSLELLVKIRDFAGQLGVELIGDSQTRLEFSNGSRIFGLPGSETTTRGFSAPDLILLDEAARIDDSLISSLRPMQATSRNAAFIAMSTPAGRRGWFFKTWQDGEGWEKVAIRADQCPRISPEWLKAERRELGDLVYRQEYENVFTDDGTAAFPSALIEAALCSSVRPLWEVAA